MQPDDPLGAVSMLTRTSSIQMVFQAMALAIVVASLATAIAGKSLPDVGTFAAAIGLAVVSFRGETAAHLLLLPESQAVGYERMLALKFSVEVLAWSSVIGVGIVVSGFVSSWLFAKAPKTEDYSPSDPGSVAHLLAGWDIPVFGRIVQAGRQYEQTTPREGIKHTLLLAGTSLFFVGLFSGGLATRGIEHGQVCFVVAASVALGCSIAGRIVPTHSVLWSIAAVPLMAIVAYLWACVMAGSGQRLPNLPASHFLRILPIQYVAIGTAAAIFMEWWSRPMVGSVALGDE